MSTIIQRARRAKALVDTFGVGWVAYRAGYAFQLRAGLLRRQTPARPWSEQPLSSLLRDPEFSDPETYLAYRRERAPRFLFSPSDRASFQPLFEAWDHGEQTPMDAAERLARGIMPYFGHVAAEVGSPPSWNHNPFTGQDWPADRHWTEIDDFGFGDVKVVWEPSRFGFAFGLVRAYWRSGDERYPDLFWRILEDWVAHNQPQKGPNWKCGQEASFRIMALCFALYGFLDAAATTPDRVALLGQVAAVTGRRIEANFGYALSQANNHAVSESLGLWSIGTLFPEMVDAPRWREIGREALESLGRDLIYDDGAFSQHFINYHRLALHDFLWSLRLASLNGQPFSEELIARVTRAGELLYQLQDARTGRVPCYGHNDGALVLPLSNCDYRDFRPVTQASSYLATGALRHVEGPWDEDLLWLFGPDALSSPRCAREQTNLVAENGGYYTLRATDGFAFVHCTTFRHRPAHADLLHLDLWWRGQNVALDPGTYSYNAPNPWNNALGSTAYHNTVTVDGLDQMDRAGKFLWMPWTHGRVRQWLESPSAQLAYWEGEHDGYLRLVRPVSHRRAVVRLGAEHWLVLDSLRSHGQHEYRLHWLLMDAPCDLDDVERTVTLQTEAGQYQVQVGADTSTCETTLVSSDPASPRGWQAPYYGAREPAQSLVVTARAQSLRFWTLLGPSPVRLESADGGLHVETNAWSARVHFDEGPETLVSGVEMRATDGERRLMDRLCTS